MPDVPSRFSGALTDHIPASHQSVHPHFQSRERSFFLRTAVSNLSIHPLPPIQHARQTRAVRIGCDFFFLKGKSPNQTMPVSSSFSTADSKHQLLAVRRELLEHSPAPQVSCRSCYCRNLETASQGVSWQLCSAELRKISPHPSCSSIKPL